MAVDEQSSPQTGNQLRPKDMNLTTNDSSSACEAVAASHQAEVSKTADSADRQTAQMNGPRTGRGRRKQCRPVRVCFRDEDDNNDDVDADAKLTEVNSLPEVENLPVLNVCELCGAEAMSPEALTAHAETCRGRYDSASDNISTSDRAFPTRYHELGDELMRSAETALHDRDRRQLDDNRPLIWPSEALPLTSALYNDDNVAARCIGRQQEVADGSESDFPLDFTIHSGEPVSTNLSSSASSSGADVAPMTSSLAAVVKHPPEMTSSTAVPVGSDAEDYCEFCQKHFCNKYYLRKHRHDVHGITASDNQSVQLQQQQRQISSTFLPADSVPLLSLASEAHTLHDNMIITSSSSTVSTSAPIQQLPFQTQLVTSLQPFVPPFQTSTTSSNSLLFQSPPSATDLASSPAATGLLPGLTSLMLLNPFASSLALLNSPSFLHQTSPAAAAAAYSASSSLNTLAELQKSNVAAAAAGGFGGLCDDVATLSALMNPFLPPSDPTSIPIEDPLSSSHYCELCRKEFCSAYFLAVHRREKHGITTSTALSDAIRLLAAGNVRSCGGLEPLGSGAEPGEKTPSVSSAAVLGKSHSDRSSTHPDGSRSATCEPVSNEHICCLCKKQFPNRYGLVLHLLSAHNIRPEGFGLAGELLQLDGVGGRSHPTAASSGKTVAGSGLASAASSTNTKQSDRVSCDICNKEVCNKYFLKTHKMKVHGLDSVAAAVYNPPPPLDSTRCEAVRSPASVSSSTRHHQQQQQQHDEMRKALLMADNQFSTFASHLDFALKSVASTDLPGTAGFGFLPPTLQQPQQQPQQPAESMMRAADIFRLFGLVGTKQDDPFLSLGPPPPPLSLQSLLPSIDLPDSMGDSAKHTKPVELKIPRHVAGMTHHHKDVASGSLQNQQTGRSKHSTSHHHGRHSREQAPATPRQSQPAAAMGPSDQELIQSGIDPEAFCELCQKEFCSKYFLRTHRQKIHGVSPNKTESSFDPYRPMPQQTAPANPMLQMFPGLPLPNQPIFGSSSAVIPPAAVAEPSSDTLVASPPNLQGRASSKEAANVTRVTCDVCGKELCNKYFLKTHMAKIHGCALGSATPGSGQTEFDAGDVVQSDAAENRMSVTSTGCSISRSSLTDDCPPANGSVSNSTENGEISPVAVDTALLKRPNSNSYTQEAGDIKTNDSSEEAAGKTENLLHQLSFTRNVSVEKEAVSDAVENSERSISDTTNKLLVDRDVETVSSHMAAEPKLHPAAQQGTDAEVRGEKRRLATDGDPAEKRARTDYPSTSIVDQVTENPPEVDDNDRSTVCSGVIQFVSRSKESMNDDSKDAFSLQTGNSRSLEMFPDVTDRQQTVSAGKQGSDLTSTELYSDAPSLTTVNGHTDPRDPDSCHSATVADKQCTSPLMQPFIVRQEPAPAVRSTAGTIETTDFAACQLVLPVVRPVRDPVTVEFCVTPVSSE